MNRDAKTPCLDDLIGLAQNVIEAYTAQGKKIATAESCTGGLIAALLTEIAGSSAVVDRGFVTYSNEAKMAMLGVSTNDLETYGAVSEQVAGSMAEGALANSLADVAVSVTGVAGPSGGSAAKPVGTVCFGLAIHDEETRTCRIVFSNNGRRGIRHETARKALQSLINFAL